MSEEGDGKKKKKRGRRGEGRNAPKATFIMFIYTLFRGKIGRFNMQHGARL